MAEAKVGDAFIKHEFDEAIAIQQTIVDAEQQLSKTHPQQDAKRLIETTLKEDKQFLQKLEQLGRQHGASGEVEDVAGGLRQLMHETMKKADKAESEAYEAHAVLLNLKRKQQDSASAMLKMAREMDDKEMRDAAQEFHKAQKDSSQELSDSLAAFAVRIATQR
jgi:hypothetical protein